MRRAILFDLDDTLYPERQFVLGGFRAVAQMLCPTLGVDLSGAFVGLVKRGTRTGIFERVLQPYMPNLTELDVKGLVDVYRRHAPRLSYFPDALECLSTLRSQVAVGLVTDGYAEVQRRKIEALSLDTYVDAIVLSDELGREYWKPHPRPFEECLRRLAVSASRAVYVADNPYKDFLGPRQLGMATVRVRRPGTLHVEARLDRDHEADRQITSLRDLAALMHEPVRVSPAL